MHVLSEFVLQVASLSVDDGKADGFLTLRLVDFVTFGQNVTHPSVQIAIANGLVALILTSFILTSFYASFGGDSARSSW
jgi:hypothetical protein